MSEILAFSPKQREVWQRTMGTGFGERARHRWNISSGAVRSGKTFLDYFRIPVRVRNAPEDGLVLLLGNTISTLERNILSPMRRIWGERMVGGISNDNSVHMFGRDCFALGADKADRAEKLQGSGLAYCYGDEITTWNERVFEMLKSRLDKPYSCFDGTCNPDAPGHWLRKFLDSGTDVCESMFVIDDNSMLDSTFVRQLKAEYAGSVYFDRYILGKWVAAEGLIYRLFCENQTKFLSNVKQKGERICIGVDWGDSKSAHAFVAVAIGPGFERLRALMSERHSAEGLTPADVERKLCAFVSKIENLFGDVDCIYCDHVNTLINGCRVALRACGTNVPVVRANKISINERIFATLRLMASGRFSMTEDCQTLANAFNRAVWDSAKPDCRRDDGSLDVDTLDAFEYAWSNYLYCLMR